MSDPQSRRIAGGFTLVELLVVIAVIGVLIALLLPAIGRSKEQARRTICRQNERQIVMAELMYARENEGNYLYYSTLYPQEIVRVESRFQWDTRPRWETFISTPDVFYCPSNPNHHPDWDGGWNNPGYMNPIHYRVDVTYNFFVGMQPVHNTGAGNVVFPTPPFPYRFQPILHEADVIDGSATPALGDICGKENPHPPGQWRGISSHLCQASITGSHQRQLEFPMDGPSRVGGLRSAGSRSEP